MLSRTCLRERCVMSVFTSMTASRFSVTSSRSIAGDAGRLPGCAGVDRTQKRGFSLHLSSSCPLVLVVNRCNLVRVSLFENGDG
jgi:hypothetical protein